ncbi:metal-dependent transcriptional regulator [bacterium]|nr:metal-dependent transcriptional regulator [bacterium]
MKELTESLEKYLFAVYELSKTNSSIIVKDVSEYLKIGGASTAKAIKTLRDKGFLNYVPYSTISLTPRGLETVELKVYRHNTITNFLNKVLDIEQKNAEKNANAIEYSMTEDVLIKFVHFLDFMGQCTCREPKWIKSCKHSLGNGEIPQKCTSCISGGCSSCNCGGQ